MIIRIIQRITVNKDAIMYFYLSFVRMLRILDCYFILK